MILLRILFIFLLATSAYANDNARLVGYPPNKLMGFSGLETRATAPTLQDGNAIIARNVKLSSAFDLKKRDGYSYIVDTLDDLDFDSPSITGIFQGRYSDASLKTFAFVGSKVKYNNSTTWTTVSGSGTITSGQDNQWKCVMALDSAICTNDVDAPIKISNTPTKSLLNTSSLSDSLDKAKDVIWYKNYLIFGNTVENSVEKPTRVRWSNVGTIETYSDADYTDLSSLAGDEITGFAELYGDLYIFLKFSIWKASYVGGASTYNLDKVIENIGSIARDSIRTIQLSNNRRAIIFLDINKKVFLFDGTNITDIGNIIQPTLDSLNEARYQYSVSTFDGKSYYLSSSSSGSTKNDTILEFQTEIGGWTTSTDINANAIGRVEETTNDIKTYYGNYKSFVYWMDNPDKLSDVCNQAGIVDSIGIVNTSTITGAQVIIDQGVSWDSSDCTGATVKILSGTGAGEEQVVVANTSTGLIVATPFTTDPDSTSVYSIGAINSEYCTKWFDFGDSSRLKGFRSVYLWGEEQSNNYVTVKYSIDFGGVLGSSTLDFSPSANSIWDEALWDQAIWGSTGDVFKTNRLKGEGRYLQLKFTNSNVEEDFHLYGYHLLADVLDRQ